MFNRSKDYINLQIKLYRGFAMQKELPETILWNIFSFVLKDDSTIFIALLRKGPEQRCLQYKRKQRVFLFRY